MAFGVQYDREEPYEIAYLVEANYKDQRNYYETLEIAFNKAENGVTIEVVKELVKDPSNAVNTKEYTIDLKENTIEKTTNTIRNEGTLIIKGGKVGTLETNEKDIASITNVGTLRLESGKVKGKENAILILENGAISLNGGNIEAGTYGIHTQGENTKISINSGNVEAGEVGILAQNGNAEIDMKAGEVVGGKHGIYDQTEGTFKIIGGIVEGVNGNGIYKIKGTTTIGEKDGIVNVNSPEIKGGTYGVCATHGFNFYDGILKGKTTAIAGDVDDVETRYEIVYGKEEDYQTATLSKVKIKVELKVDQTIYNGEWTNKDVKAIITLPENMPNINEVFYKTKNGEYGPHENTTYSNNRIIITFKDEVFNDEVTFVGVNTEGQIMTDETKAYAIKIDKIAPEILSLTKTPYNDKIDITMTVRDLESKVKYYSVSNRNLVDEWKELETSVENGNITFTIPAKQNMYLYVKDEAGNVSKEKSITIYSDITPPVGTIKVEGNIIDGISYVNNKHVSLKLTANDNLTRTEDIKIKIYNKEDFDKLTTLEGIDWEDYKEKIEWDLTDGDGLKYVYLILKDASGNVSIAFPETIDIDL